LALGCAELPGLAEAMTRAGIVTLVGRPNAGKSTLLNRWIGQKLSIVSPKPQSTRDRVVGIISRDDAQMVLLDTPGLLAPEYELHRVMHSVAAAAIRDADIIIHLVDANNPVIDSLSTAAGMPLPAATQLVTFNKIDCLDRESEGRLRQSHPDASFISALSGDGVADLEARVTQMLPESQFLYPPDEISTQHLRYFAAEFVREAALERLGDEVPYSVAVVVEEFREDRVPTYIRAVVYLERESQKRIFIGAGGSMIRTIGQDSRKKVEALIGHPVYLDLWVKVLPNWRRTPAALARLGYHISKDQQ
jgi:GTP-binding protein Era